MLLVTFHGSGSGIKNVCAYSTGKHRGTLENGNALAGAPKGSLDELRAMVVYDSNLYVVIGKQTDSSIMAFGPPKKDSAFDYLATMISAGKSIMHPFALAFDPSSPVCYVSNQDSNVVAKVTLSKGKHGAMVGSLGSGCQSPYLSGLYKPPQWAFLDGTFVGSQVGELANIKLANIPNVSKTNGGLGVTGTGTPLAPSNSVRDVALANGILFVCDEVDEQINMYSLNATGSVAQGAYLGSGSTKGNKPTHLAINGKGLWVSADDKLYWSALPSSVTGASLAFSSVKIDVPAKNKIGGISFDEKGNVYVIFQDGTSGTGTGSIWEYEVKSGSPPTLHQAESFVTGLSDTPEFSLWVSDSHWPS